MGGHIGPPLRKLSSTAVPPGESQFSDFRRALPRETGVKRVETADVYPFAPLGVGTPSPAGSEMFRN